MNGHRNDHAICHVCQKTFSSGSTRNRHLRRVHHEEIKTTVHVKCPLCTEEGKISFRTHDLLIKHLEQIHSLNIKTSSYEFGSMEEFESWRALNRRNVDYALKTKLTGTNDIKWIYYNCKRSDSKGFVSRCVQRKMKTGGSIKISGMCPSRICVRISSSGLKVKFIETHVGHDELRSKHPKKDHPETIVRKLKSKVTQEIVLEEATVIKRSKHPKKDHPETIVRKLKSEVTQERVLEKATVIKDHRIERACKLLKLMNEENFNKIIDSIEKTYSEQSKNAFDH